MNKILVQFEEAYKISIPELLREFSKVNLIGRVNKMPRRLFVQVITR